jgi:hypothetical protein
MAVWIFDVTACTISKLKAVPRHPRKALGWRGGAAPTHSRPQHYMGWVVVMTPRLSPRRKDSRYPLYRRLGGPQSWSVREAKGKKSFCLCRRLNLGHLVYPVARHYTVWAAVLPNISQLHCINISYCLRTTIRFLTPSEWCMPQLSTPVLKKALESP